MKNILWNKFIKVDVFILIFYKWIIKISILLTLKWFYLKQIKVNTLWLEFYSVYEFIKIILY